MRWFWAAYKLGAFKELFDANLTDEVFSDHMLDLLSAFPYGWVIEAMGEEGIRPVGLILGEPRAAGRGVEPHIDWFPWATSRNRIEGMAVFLRDVSKSLKLFVYVTEDESDLWVWFKKRRMLAEGGRITDYFARGDHARFFYTAGP